MRWVEIAIQAAPASVDAASNVLIEEGCGGTVIGPDPPGLVTGYLPVDDRLEERLESIRSRIASFADYGLKLQSDDLTVRWIADEQWATAWKKHFKPVRIGRVVVKPTWEPWPRDPSTSSECSEIVVEIDPGMAFGTGYHPTTQLCLLAAQDIIKGGEAALDVGTGSGVLAIAAAKLGARSVVGLDIDSVAVEVAEANVRQAGLSDRIVIRQADSPSAFDGQADVVFANIIAKVLIDMAGALAEKVKIGGKVVASGIVTERASGVTEAFDSVGLRVVEERTDGDWVALVCERAA